MVTALDRLSDVAANADPAKLREFMARFEGKPEAAVISKAMQFHTQRADEDDWARWLPWLFPTYFPVPFAAHHGELWEWVWSIERDVKPDKAFIACWARGGAKSTCAEAAVVSLGARRRRKYVVYVSETQAQADTHVGNIGTMLESDQVARAYPDLGARAVGKFGSYKAWRRNRLRAADGFTVDALGLDTAARGLKIDEERPDLIVFDDIDADTDGPGLVRKKIDAITKKLLPAGAADVAVLGIQNLVNPAGVFAHLVLDVDDEIEDFLTNRIVSGPIPAVWDATFDRDENGAWTITSGEPAWEGQNLDICRGQIGEWGITAFKAEGQHDTDAKGGGMFDHIEFAHCTRDEVPALTRVECWVDPAVTNTDKSDSMACQVDGLGVDKVIYRLRSWEKRASPVDALKLAVAWAMCEGARAVGVETDQGGDTWRSVLREAVKAVRADLKTVRDGDGINSDIPDYVNAIAELSGRDQRTILNPRFAEAKAGSTQQPKEHRIQQMLAQGYEQAGAIVHVIGWHLMLERALFRFPARKPYDLADASYWSWVHLSVYGQPVKTSAPRTVAPKQLPKFPIARGGASAAPRVGFGRPSSR